LSNLGGTCTSLGPAVVYGQWGVAP
jgi:hypothetical protein